MAPSVSTLTDAEIVRVFFVETFSQVYLLPCQVFVVQGEEGDCKVLTATN